MPSIKPIKEIIVNDFNHFCEKFKIKTSKIAGDNGCDDELIMEELDKISNQNWLVSFVDNNRDGYFKLILIK